MKKMRSLIAVLLMALVAQSCTENYSNGERVGFVTKFSKKGLVWKTWEGDLNVTQTGMNTSSLFDFSVDRDALDPVLVSQLDSAALNGWKVKLTYHETLGKNWFGNRGATDYFVTGCEVLDKHPMQSIGGGDRAGRVVDTIYVVIDKSK